MPKLASDKHCTGCMACYDACKYKAIGVIEKIANLMWKWIRMLA